MESPQATLGALETTAGNVEVEPPVAFDTGLNAPTCDAFVASAQLEDKHIPCAGPRELTEHPLLLPEALELETQTLSVCCCDELQTGPFWGMNEIENIWRTILGCRWGAFQWSAFRAYDLMSSRQAIG